MADDELKQRIASGELTPDAVRIARDVLLQRLGGDGLEPIPTSGHEAMLVMIYGQMHKDEIKQRLASDALIPLARTVAQAELKRRAARGEPARLRLREKIAQYRQNQHFADMPMSTLGAVAI